MLIEKKSGEMEAFNPKKLAKSLRKAGLSKGAIDNIVAKVAASKPTKSVEIYEKALEQSLKHNRKAGLHYNLKQALLELGPSGYPFEQFIGALFETLGWKARTNLIIEGSCVDHEVDVLLEKEHVTAVVECKFRNQRGAKVNVKVPMYIKSRFEDVVPTLNQHERRGEDRTYQAWVVTNTKFTVDAINFGECANMKLISWGYPNKGNLQDLIMEAGVAPITILPHLTLKQKKHLATKGIVLCHQLLKNKHLLGQFGFRKKLIQHITEDAKTLCKMNRSAK